MCLFKDTIEASTGAGGFVKEFSLNFVSEQDDKETLSSKDFLRLLEHLPACTDLILKHSTRLIKAFLSDTKSRRLLPSVQYVHLVDPFTGWSNPFDQAHYLRLCRHPNLGHLNLDVERTYESIGRSTPADVVKSLNGKWQWVIELRGPLAHPAVGDLLFLFDQIHTLKLLETAATEEIPVLLECVPSWDLLRRLSFNYPSPLTPATIENLAVSLSLFPFLQTLEFCRYSFSSSLLSLLPSFPCLEEFSFLHNSGVVASDIKHLLSDSKRFPKLLRLDLSHVSFYSWDEKGRPGKEPVWVQSFSRQDAEDIYTMCEERSVACEGIIGEFIRREREREVVEKRAKPAGRVKLIEEDRVGDSG